MDESLPWPFFRVNDFLEVYLDKNHKWHVVEYAPHEMDKYCYGNRITRILHKMDQYEVNRKIIIKNSWFSSVNMYPSCFTATDNTKGIDHIRSYIDGRILEKFPKGTYSPNPIIMGIKFVNNIIQITCYNKNTIDLPSAVVIDNEKSDLRFNYEIQDNYILMTASDIVDIKNTENYALTYTKVRHDLLVICVSFRDTQEFKPSRTKAALRQSGD